MELTDKEKRFEWFLKLTRIVIVLVIAAILILKGYWAGSLIILILYFGEKIEKYIRLYKNGKYKHGLDRMGELIYYMGIIAIIGLFLGLIIKIFYLSLKVCFGVMPGDRVFGVVGAILTGLALWGISKGLLPVIVDGLKENRESRRRKKHWRNNKLGPPSMWRLGVRDWETWLGLLIGLGAVGLMFLTDLS